jgi:hypothetical protein
MFGEAPHNGGPCDFGKDVRTFVRKPLHSLGLAQPFTRGCELDEQNLDWLTMGLGRWLV